MKTHSTLIALACLACAPVALAQEEPGLPAPEIPLFEPDDEEADRPLARALAFNRRDVIAQLLQNPGSLAAASAAIAASGSDGSKNESPSCGNAKPCSSTWSCCSV